MMLFYLFVVSSVLLFQTTSGQQVVGTINFVTNVGLLNVFEHSNPSSPQTRYSILAGAWDTGRGTRDNAYVMLHPGTEIASGFEGYRAKLIYNVLYWPKEVRQVPGQVFSFNAVVSPDGSQIVGKEQGSIYITNVNDFNFPATFDILAPRLPVPSTYSYSSVVWLRCDAGTTWDILGCRHRFDGTTLVESQLFWVEHPTLNEMENQWSLSVLKESACDTNVALTSSDLPGIGNSYDVLYTTGLHLRRLSLFYTTSNLGYWTNPSNIEGLVIAAGRPFFDVQIADINKDGNNDVLTTAVDRMNGTVEVFEIPADFREVNQYVRHVIASGFAARTGGSAGLTPGVARPFYPTSNTNVKPYIAVSGADDGRAYVLRPVSQDSNNWDYEVDTIADYGLVQIVSGITAADIDGDGFTELFVSVHNSNYVQVFSYRP